MKKIFALILSAILLLSGFAFAEEKDYDSITVGTYTPFTGRFCTDLWGSSTSDIDVRSLLHGYSMVTFDSTLGTFVVNPTVVSGFVIKENDLKEHIYSIALYDDLKYSDGTPITAWDYAFSFLLVSDPAIGELGGREGSRSFLKGTEDYRTGKSSVISGVHVSSDHMLDITVSKEALPFFYELSYLDINPYPASVLVPGCTVKDSGNGVYLSRHPTADELREALFGENGYVSHPGVVSGPYMLKYCDGERAEFELNPYFKGDAEGNKPVFQTITYVPVTAENAVEKLASGEIDLINKSTSREPTSASMELVGSGYSMTPYPRNGLSLISFCCEGEKAGSESVRKALAIIMDKEGFTEAYVGDNGLVTEGFYGLGQWMYKVVTGTMDPPVRNPGENASEKERKAYTSSLKQWERLSLKNVKIWEGAAGNAESLLIKGGWTLNPEGKKYDPQKDTIRARKTDDGRIVALDMTLCCPAGVGVKDALEEYFAKPAGEIGIRITVKEIEWEELLKLYYRTEGRDCDMIYVASNFEAAFDPSILFDPSVEAQGYMNRTGITNEELYKRALALSETEPGDTYNYCRKWIDFQECYAEVMPAIPVYTNVYYDFYIETLREYEVGAYTGWPGAILKAYLSDFAEAGEAGQTEESAG